MMEKKNKKFMYGICSIIALVLLIVGITLAYWFITKMQTNENFVSSSCLNFSLTNEQNNIELLDAMPVLDKDGKTLQPYTFTIQNDCESYVSYDINLEALQETDFVDRHYIKVLLNETGKEGIIDFYDQYEDATQVIDNSLESRKLSSGMLNPQGQAGSSKNYELRLWLDEDTPMEEEYMNKAFKSKIVVSGEYKNADYLVPTAELSLTYCENSITAKVTGKALGDKTITKYEFQLDEQPWESGVSSSKTFSEVYRGNHTIKVKVTDSKDLVSNEVVQEVNTNEKVNLLGMEVPLAICNEGLYPVSHTLNELTRDWGQTEYRYAGKDPDNYVEFNNEIWRIIGLVNVKNENRNMVQRVKIIRVDGIGEQKDFGNFSFDTNSGYKNNWPITHLNKMLNDTYYNSTSGDCYTAAEGSYGAKSTCDFSGASETYPKGLDSTAQSMVDADVIWSLGGWSTSILSVNDFYEKERGSTVVEGNDLVWSKETDETYHKGISILYPSDYGYATTGGSYGRQNCFGASLYSWNLSYYAGCTDNDWLKSNSIIWTLTHASSLNNYVYDLTADGVTRGAYASYSYGVWPTLYLAPNVTISEGDGSFTNPYKLVQN